MSEITKKGRAHSKTPDAAGSSPDAEGTGRGRRWQPVSRTRTYEQVVDRIEEQIVNGDLRAGERLPAERDLATLLGVSRPVVREALRILEAQGVVRSQVGTGPDSGTTIDAVPGDALARLLRLHVALGSFPLQDVVEVRVALERSSVALACRQADQRDLERIQVAVDAMDVHDVTRETFNRWDTDFHVALADAGGNRLMSDVTGAIRESVRLPILASLSAMQEDGAGGWPTVRDGLRADHHAILDAVLAGAADLAADRLEAHIRGFSARMTRD